VNFNGKNGAGPEAALVQASDGSLYGTTVVGGAGGYGSVFRITTQGALQTLYSFCTLPNCSDGAYPYGGVVQGPNGNFYGMTFQGGAGCAAAGGGCGTVYRITPQGVLTTLHSFDGNDGGFSYAGLVLGKDGLFYGTTIYGEPTDSGTIFKITADGKFTNLYTFCARTGCPDGSTPLQLVQDAAGNFYGTTAGGGGPNNGGTVFKVTSSGTLTTLHKFCALANCPDGAKPEGTLLIAGDGNLYATTYAGGAFGFGTAYRISPIGAFKKLHNFNGSEGSNPYDGLSIGSNGSFYGTTAFGGTYGNGTIFTMNTAGSVNVLHDFQQGGGFDSQTGLTLARDGNFYGTTYLGGSGMNGTLFKLAPRL
jgi:uncharacterized repeat protein (TIGR03803 family)